MRKIKLTRANKSILLKALAPYYYREKALGHSTEKPGRLILKIDSVPADKKATFATVYKGNIIKNLIMDCQSYTKYRPNETTGGIFVSWRRKEELPTGA